MRAFNMYVGVKKIETSGGLGQRWLTLNNREKDKKEEQEEVTLK
jgi:hypothetical protein